MILQQLKAALQDKEWVDQQQLMTQFNLSQDALESMLLVWMRRGQVVKSDASHCGSGCGTCRDDAAYYRWVESGQIGLEQD